MKMKEVKKIKDDEIKTILMDKDVEYFINDDGKVDFHGDVLIKKDIKELPFQIGAVFGDFRMTNYNNAKLINGPEYVMGDFVLTNSLIESVENFPVKVEGNIDLQKNRLTSITLPNNFKGELDIDNNFIMFLPKMDHDDISFSLCPILKDAKITIDNLELEFEEFMSNDFWFSVINSNMTLDVETHYESVEKRYDTVNKIKNNMENVILSYPKGIRQDVDDLKGFIMRSRNAEQHKDILDF